MRMRFCATIRRPAFSITALTAPVRFRAVASGLMIEKVRSIAMICPWKTAGGEVAGLISAAPALGKRPGDALRPPLLAHGLRQFHPDEPSLTRSCRLHSASQG